MGETIRQESIERPPRPDRAIVFVPGLGEGATTIFSDLLAGLREDLQARGVEPTEVRAVLQSTPLFTVSTHPTHESAQDPNKTMQSDGVPPPITCMVSDDTEHKSLEHRVELVQRALQEAIRTGTKEIEVVGHSAGGIAALTAILREASNNLDIQFNATLIAPAVPGEVNKFILVESVFLKTVIRDIFTKIGTWGSGHSYARDLLTGGEIVPSIEDLERILGPIHDREFFDRVSAGAVPISGGEAFDLLLYPKALEGLTAIDMPSNVTVKVVVPKGDNWVNRIGQWRLVTGALRSLMGKKATGHEVEGGHLPLGGQDPAFADIIDLINKER